MAWKHDNPSCSGLNSPVFTDNPSGYFDWFDDCASGPDFDIGDGPGLGGDDPPPPPPCFPPAGKDVMDSVLLHDIDIVGIGLCRANLAGPVVVAQR